jgi:hypothetical protein
MTSTYRSFPSRPGGVTEWEKEDYEKSDGVSAPESFLDHVIID